MARKNISLEAIEETELKENNNQIISKFNKNNYLNIKLDKGENEKEIKFRLLPIDKNSDTPFKHVMMHMIKLPKGIFPGVEWKSYVCLEKEPDIDHNSLGNKCPFCEMQRYAYNKKEEAIKAAKDRGDDPKEDPDVTRWKEISFANMATAYCVMRGIERGAEADGPKFLKVSVRSDGMDVESQIRSIVKDKKNESIEEAMDENGGVLPEGFQPYNALDVDNGMDLKFTIKRIFDKQGKPTNKTSISVAAYGKPKPLSTDDEQIDKWIDDDKLWSDVFVAKPYEYCDLIIKGEQPFFDKNQQKWIPRVNNSSKEEDNDISGKENNNMSEVNVTEEKNFSVEDDEDVEDLPF